MAEEGIPVSIESRRLEDGRGGIFINGELTQTFDTEAESDSVAIYTCRMMAIGGIAKQVGQAYKDEKPIDLFDMEIR